MKFRYKDRVKIKKGFFKGYIGKCQSYSFSFGYMIRIYDGDEYMTSQYMWGWNLEKIKENEK